MAASQLCQRCAKGQRPESYVVSLAGSCCQCGVGEKEKSRCGACGNGGSHCAQCSEFNGYFELKRSDSDCCLYEYEFPLDDQGKTPCGATKIQMRLRPHQDDDKVNVCVGIIFDQGQGTVRPVSWGKTNVGDCCQIGVLRRRTTNSKCCWPHQITVTPVPVPDYVVPEPEWAISDPDDLNDAPYWPKMDVDLMEDSDGVPVRYFNGELQLRRKDLGSDGFGIPWGHTRIYSNRLSNSFDFGNGFNWLVHEWPRLILLKTSTKLLKTLAPWFGDPANTSTVATGCTIVVLRGTRNALWFDQYKLTDPLTGDVEHFWAPRFGAKHSLTHDDHKDFVFKLAAPNGQRWYFYDFTPVNGQSLQHVSRSVRDKRSPGCLKQHVSSGGQKFDFEYKSCKLQSATREYRQNAAPYEYAHETFEYTYYDDAGATPCTCSNDDPNKGRLCTVLLKRKDANGTKTNVRRVHFVYYADKQNEKDHGKVGDLKLAVVQAPGQNAWRNLAVDYYRYHTKAYDTYCQGMLKYFVGPEAFRRIVRKTKSMNPPAPDAEIAPELLWIADHSVDHLANLVDTVMESTIQQFADLHVEYHEADRRVKEITIAGGDHKRTFAYQLDKQADANELSEFNKGKWVTTEVRPGYGGVVTVRSNIVGQTTLHTLTDDRTRLFHRRFKYAFERPTLVRLFEPSALDGQGNIRSGGLHYRYHHLTPVTACDYLREVIVSGELVQAYDYAVYDHSALGQSVPGDDPFKLVAVTKATSFKVTNEYTVWTPYGSARSTDSYVTYVNDFSGRHLQQRDTVLLDVSTEHNGQYQPGSPPSGKSRIVERFDKFGNLVSVTDLRRAVTESEFHVATGAPKFVKVKFNRPFPQGTHTIQTSFKSDQLGRITQVLGPEHDAVVDVSTGAIARVRTATWHVYKDISGQLWTAHGHVAGQTEVQINPLQIDRVDRAGRVTDSILALRSQQGRPSPQETMIGRQNWGGWVSRQHDDRSRLVESRVYHRIPSVGTGAQGVNFDATRTKFDEMRRPNVMRTPGGTENKVEYSSRGLVTRVHVGVATLQLAVENFYDHEELNADATGNGLLTKRVAHLGDGSAHVSGFDYDRRDRVVRARVTDGIHTTEREFNYTNQDRISEYRSSTSLGPPGIRTVNLIDVRGRMFRTVHTGIDPDPRRPNQILTPVVDNVWYNDAGDVLRNQPHGSDLFVRSEYDGLGREVKRIVGADSFTTQQAKSDFDAGAPNRVDPSKASPAETIYEISRSAYDDASNLLAVVTQFRGPERSGVTPTYRSGLVWMTYDSLGRPLSTSDNGAHSPAPMTSSTRFDNFGNAYLVNDPLGRSTVRRFDHAQRVVEVTENQSGTAPGSRTTAFEYSPDGATKKVTFRPPGRNSQVTEFEFNDPTFSHLASAIRYPGASSMTDRESFEYNLMGEVARYTDRNGNRHRFVYDQLRRLVSDKVEAFGTGVDTTINEIAYEYDPLTEQLRVIGSRGPIQSSNSVEKNLVQRDFNARQQVSKEIQWHNDPGPRFPFSVTVGYEYADGSANHMRLKRIVYPYAPANVGIDYDNLGRVSSISDAVRQNSQGGPTLVKTPLVSYGYCGADRLYRVALRASYSQFSNRTEIASSLGSQPHPDFSEVDAFDRRASSVWQREEQGFLPVALEQIGHKYLLQGIRRYREDIQAGSNDRSQLYQYDGLDRLTGVSRGRLATLAGQPTIAAVNLTQSWGLDGADNWGAHSQWVSAPSGGWQGQLQQRTHDDSNRLTNLRRTANEVKQVRIDDTLPTSGNFTLTINNQTTANIAHNATAATVQSRLEALSSIGSGNVKCAGGPLPDQAVYIEFVGTLANQNISPLSGNSNLNSGTLVLSTLMEGGLAQLVAKHDKSGNMTRIPDVFKRQKVECFYDAWNRLAAVTKDGDEVVRYGYDGLHRRITKTLPGQSVRHYYYSLDDQVLEERVIPGLNGKTKVEEVNADRWYVWGIRGLDDLVARGRITSVNLPQLPGYSFERQFALQDDNFNVTAITDYSGQVVERFTYDPYGQFEIYDKDYRARIKSKYDWDILYAGYRFDWESGLYHVRRRQFSPYLGRWLQADPLGYVDSYNLYQYCHSSPVNYIDPTGELDPLSISVALLAVGLVLLVPALAHAPGSREDVAAIPALERQQFETNARTVGFLLSIPVGGQVWSAARAAGWGFFATGAATGISVNATEDVVMLGAMGDAFHNYRDDSGNVSVTRIVASYGLSAIAGGLTELGLGAGLPWVGRQVGHWLPRPRELSWAQFRRLHQGLGLANDKSFYSFSRGFQMRKLSFAHYAGWRSAVGARNVVRGLGGSIEYAATQAAVGARYFLSHAGIYDDRAWGVIRAERNAGLLNTIGPNWTWEHMFIKQWMIRRWPGLRGWGNAYWNTFLRISRSRNSSGGRSLATDLSIKGSVLLGAPAAFGIGYSAGTVIWDLLDDGRLDQ